MLPKNAGDARGNWVLIDLGSGTSTVEGAIAAGSEITADAGHVGDHIEVVPDVRLHGLNPTDVLSWGGRVLTGGIHNTESDDPWGYDFGHFVRYGINALGDLAIQTIQKFGDAPEDSTYIAGYTNGDAGGNANASAHIYTLDVTFSAISLLDSKPGWLDGLFRATLGNITKALNGFSLYQGVDPLVLDLGGHGIATTPLEVGSPTSFDINTDGFANASGWIGPQDGFLVHLDSANGTVGSARQFFGSQTVDGFQQLATYDTNHNGVVDASDAGRSSLRIWQDNGGTAGPGALAGNEQVDPGELVTLDQAGIASISLAETPLVHDMQQGNQIRATATFTRTDGATSTIADVQLATDNFNGTYLGQAPVSALAATLPDVVGHGTLLSLRQAMSASETQGADAAGNPAVVPSALEAAVTAALGGFQPGGTLDDWRVAMQPVLAAWIAALPDPKAGAPGWWTDTADANGNPVQGAPKGRPDLYTVIFTGDIGTLVEDDVEYATFTVKAGQIDPAKSQIATQDVTYGYWHFAGGRPVFDAAGHNIFFPTLAQVLATPLRAGESWSVMRAGELAFLERFTGEALPLGQTADEAVAFGAARNAALNTLNGFLDLVALRFALQTPALQPYVSSIRYDAGTDKFTANTDLGIAPVYEKVFAGAAAQRMDHDTELAWLRNWWTVLANVLPSFDRGNGLKVTGSFLLGNVVAGWESAPGAVSLLEAAAALGCDMGKVVAKTGVAQGKDGGGELVYIGAGLASFSDDGGSSPEIYVAGRAFGAVTITQSERIFSGQADILRFANLASADIVATRDGKDLLLATQDGLHTIRLVDEFVWDEQNSNTFESGNYAPHHGVGNIIFADGVTWDRFAIAFATALHGTHDQVVTGTSGHEVLYAGPNDTLNAGGGTNIYVFDAGSGHNTIDMSGILFVYGKFDLLEFGPGIALGDLVLTRGNDPNDLLITVRGT